MCASGVVLTSKQSFVSINTVFNTPNSINLQDLQMNAIGYARLALDKTCKTCNPSVPIRTWTTDPRITQLGGFVSPRPRIYTYQVESVWPGRGGRSLAPPTV